MRRAPLLVMLAATLVAPGTAEAQPGVPRVYTMNIKLDRADLPAWIEYYQQHELPVLQALVDDGILLAFDLWRHTIGGEHTLRYNYVVPTFGAVAEVGAAFGQRADSATAAGFGAAVGTVREMTDEMWYIRDSNIPDGRSPSPYVYESLYQVEPVGRDRWNADFETYQRPALERAMEAGLLAAWAKLEHSIGGPWNYRYVYWLTSWDSADDLLEMLSRTAQELGATLEGSDRVRAHTDIIWRPVPRSGM